MKTLFIFIAVFGLVAGTANAQVTPDTTKAETFEFEWEGKTYMMQKYFIVFLKAGPTRNQTKEEADKIQKEHLAYLGGLVNSGILLINGPSDGENGVQGLSVYATATKEQARRLAMADPAVKAGRLVVEVHDWWAAQGSALK